MLDGVDWVASFLAALRIGAVPVPMSTMLTGPELAFQCNDARARMVIASAALGAAVKEMQAACDELENLVIAGDGEAEVGIAGPVRVHRFDEWTGGQPTEATPYATFPMSVGARTIVDPARPTPQGVAAAVAEHRPTLFFAVPTFYAAVLAADLPADTFSSVRVAVSAGEPLPAGLYHRFKERFGVDVLDGIGTTEALHIFISNRPDDIRPGTTGSVVPGYQVRLVDDHGQAVPDGSSGHLLVSGESVTTGYWCRTATNRRTFEGPWLRTGDVYSRSADGVFTYAGRSDDMIKAGGIWVSPAEVEATLVQHPDVLEAAVVGRRTPEGLHEPAAYVVRLPGRSPAPSELVDFCRERMAAFKRPRQVVFVDDLPKTATGKIQRYKLRDD